MKKAIFLFFIITGIVFSGCIQTTPEKPCTDYNEENCPANCVVCPPCEVCSSVSCQTEEFCKNLGFDRSWWQEVTKNLENQK